MALGHEVRLIPPRYAKPYVKRSKTDAADAEAICEAVARPSSSRSAPADGTIRGIVQRRGTRFVPVKSKESQGLLTLRRVRALLVRQRTGSVNSARGLLGEFGIVAAQGISRVATLRREMEAAKGGVLPREALTALDLLFEHLDDLTKKLDAVDRDILARREASEASQRLATAPGVGPLTAAALIAAVWDASQFASVGHFAASGRRRASGVTPGLAPRISASGCREHIGRIGKGGDRYLRTLPIHGARAMAGASFRRGVKPRPWLQAPIGRRPVNVASVAVAHKTARALWAKIRREEACRPPAIFMAAA